MQTLGLRSTTGTLAAHARGEAAGNGGDQPGAGRSQAVALLLQRPPQCHRTPWLTGAACGAAAGLFVADARLAELEICTEAGESL